MGLFSKPDVSYLGVDIGARGIKLVELRKNKGRPQLWTYGILDEPLQIHATDVSIDTSASGVSQTEFLGITTDSGKKKKSSDIDRLLTSEQKEQAVEYGRLLKTLAEKSRVTTHRATASLPVSAIFHAVLTFPVVPEKEVPIIVEAEVKKLSNRPVEELQIVHQVIPAPAGDTNYMRVLVTAAPRTLVAFYTSLFHHAGLQLQELETEAFALERSLVGRDTTTAMIVDVGAERTNFFIIDGGLPMTHRSVQFGGANIDAVLESILSIDGKKIDQVKADLGHVANGVLDHAPFMDILDVIAKEIQYSFDLFLNQMGNQEKRPEKIILTGGAALFPVIKEELERRFAMKVFIGDPWARVVYQQELKPLLSDIGPRMSASIGLALRNIVS